MPTALPVRLADQDRGAWNRAAIAEGLGIVRHCLRRNRPGPYQIQAAINAVHADAATRRRHRLAPDRRALRSPAGADAVTDRRACIARWPWPKSTARRPALAIVDGLAVAHRAALDTTAPRDPCRSADARSAGATTAVDGPRCGAGVRRQRSRAPPPRPPPRRAQRRLSPAAAPHDEQARCGGPASPPRRPARPDRPAWPGASRSRCAAPWCDPRSARRRSAPPPAGRGRVASGDARSLAMKSKPSISGMPMSTISTSGARGRQVGQRRRRRREGRRPPPRPSRARRAAAPAHPSSSSMATTRTPREVAEAGQRRRLRLGARMLAASRRRSSGARSSAAAGPGTSRPCPRPRWRPRPCRRASRRGGGRSPGRARGRRSCASMPASACRNRSNT